MGEPTFPRCPPAPLASRPLQYPSRSSPWPASRAAFRIVHYTQCRHTCNIVFGGSSQRASASTASGSEDMPISDNSLRGPTTQTSRRPKPMDSGALVAFPLSFPNSPYFALIGAVPHAQGSETGLLVDCRRLDLSRHLVTSTSVSWRAPTCQASQARLLLNSMAQASTIHSSSLFLTVPFLSQRHGFLSFLCGLCLKLHQSALGGRAR